MNDLRNALRKFIGREIEIMYDDEVYTGTLLKVRRTYFLISDVGGGYYVPVERYCLYRNVKCVTIINF